MHSFKLAMPLPHNSKSFNDIFCGKKNVANKIATKKLPHLKLAMETIRCIMKKCAEYFVLAKLLSGEIELYLMYWRSFIEIDSNASVTSYFKTDTTIYLWGTNFT